MSDFNPKILEILKEIKGTGAFVSSFVNDFEFPGLVIDGVGEIGFPISIQQTKEMLTVAHRASFGKGSETVYDPNVRNTWEIDAEMVSFKNKDWQVLVRKNLERIKVDFGIESQTISANLYKLLIYQEGDFFKMHKDSEKEKGMFGTMVIGLPSIHKGGDLIVEFENKSKRICFSEPTSNYKIPVVSFYADCDHEVTPVTSGYRVCLIYNLVQHTQEKKIELFYLGEHVEKLVEILRNDVQDSSPLKIVLLEHQYTPANFSKQALKHNDSSKAEALMQAAEKAGYYAKLGLVTSYRTGELISDYDYYDYRSSRYHDDDEDEEDDVVDGEMGEIYDENLAIEHWAEEKNPSLGVLNVEETDLISNIKLNEGEPDEKEATGYTGNAGMEMQYWYHYGAVVLWKKSKQEEVLLSLGLNEKLKWLEFYVENWNTIDDFEKNIAKTLVSTGLINTDYSADYSSVSKFLMILDDPNFIQKEAVEVLSVNFVKITTQSFVELIGKYSISVFDNLFNLVSNTRSLKEVSHLLKIINQLIILDRKYENFVVNTLQRVFKSLPDLPLSDKKEKSSAISILNSVLNLSSLIELDINLTDKLVSNFMHKTGREYVNEVLIATVLEMKISSKFANILTKECKEYLVCRIENKPTPPANWTREVPITRSFKQEWAILRPFLESPTEQIFDYKKLQAERITMESAIRKEIVDLKIETIKKGSPHTLRLTKNQASYERALKNWEADVQLLNKVEIYQKG